MMPSFMTSKELSLQTDIITGLGLCFNRSKSLREIRFVSKICALVNRSNSKCQSAMSKQWPYEFTSIEQLWPSLADLEPRELLDLFLLTKTAVVLRAPCTIPASCILRSCEASSFMRVRVVRRSV